MALTIIGKLEKISDIKSIPTKSGEDFLTRSIQLDTTPVDSFTGERGAENHPSFDLNGKATALADQFKVGDIVVVSFVIEGVLINKDGVEKQFNRLRAYKVEAYTSRFAKKEQTAETPATQQPQPQQTGAEPVKLKEVVQDQLPF